MTSTITDDLGGTGSPVSTDELDAVRTSKAVKVPCYVATTGNITLSGEQTIDGQSATSGKRVLVWQQSSAVDNGIWVCAAGAWSRAIDFDGPSDITQGTRVFVANGTAYGSREFQVTTSSAITIGSTSIAFALVDSVLASSLTQYGVVFAASSNAIQSTAAMTDGQLLVGQSGGAPLPKTITGDVSISAAGVTAIAAGVVALSMLADLTGLSVIGRAANSTGVPAAITAGTDNTVLRRSGTSIAFGTINAGSFTANAIANADLRQSAGLSLIGRSANSTGNVADITAGADGDVLRRSGTSIGFGNIGANPTGTIGLSAVNGSANTYLRSDGAPALSQAIAPTWTGLHTFTTGGALFSGTPPLTVTVAVNPYFLEDSKTGIHVNYATASATSPESGIQVNMTNALGFGDGTAFKVGIFSAVTTASGAGDSYAGNFVLDIGSGTGAINGIPLEADINVRNQNYGDATGAPSGALAAAFYAATGGTKRGTSMVLLNFANAGAPTANEPMNRGICFYGGKVRLNVYEDWLDAQGGIVIGGNKTNCIDTTNATVSGLQIHCTGFDVGPTGTITSGVWNGTTIAVANGGTGAMTAAGARTAFGYDSNSYTPTLTNVANVAATTAYTAYWMQWADRVWVWGRFDIDPTAAAPTQTTMGISLPVASNLGAAEDLGGTANSATVQQGGAIWGDATNNRAEYNYIATNAGNAPHTFHFSYRVI